MLVRLFLRAARLLILLVALFPCWPLAAQSIPSTEAPPQEVGPYLAHIVPGGPALVKPLPKSLATASAWTEWVWLRLPITSSPETALIAGMGDPAKPSSRFFLLQEGRPGIRTSAGSMLLAPAPLLPGGWHFVLASSNVDGLKLYVDGKLAASGKAASAPAAAQIQLAPLPPAGSDLGHSDCDLAFGAVDYALPPSQIAVLVAARPNFAVRVFEDNAKPWPIQVRQWVGYTAPQAPDLMPHGEPAEQPHAQPLPPFTPTLHSVGEHTWKIAANWRLKSNDGVRPFQPSDGAHISQLGFDDSSWLPATVPGTVLTTMIDRGIYPNPSFGLNNLAIPESLNKHDYWYRVEFQPPSDGAAQHREIHFSGINYTADVWLNGTHLGEIRGAFRRGDFDVSKLLRTGRLNVLAVRVSPPPHPGIPQEQSLKAGPGANGGMMVIDGPTFVDTEGWDWIPAIRDRDTGLWQDVTLTETGAVTLGDPQVITRLPLPDRSSSDITINVPIHNAGKVTVPIVLIAAFEGVRLRISANAAPGDSMLHLAPARFPQLHLNHPRLWWPNGYGAPALYHLKLLLQNSSGMFSDVRKLTFGVREISYELSLFNPHGQIDRVEVIPTETLGKGYDAVDVRHENIRQTATGWASSITPEAEGTSAIRPVTDEPGMTDLVIKVNGVRIAARGGNWGMDDALKRVSRQRLEPYFRLHREANLNIIRNWVGQNTEEVFYQLADEYGMMVWNDFWESTENVNAQPEDLQLFLDNARDTVRRFRNHPSIVLWCGRNEGVPQPVLNEDLIAMLHQEDGTRFYTPSSNQVNLRPSGPYRWQPPAFYFGKTNAGFSVELGISSFPTREAFEHTVAASDRWPISDAWAYHDWHQAGGGDTHELMRKLDLQLGPSTSLAEFERRIQMFNYVDHQAIFEGFYQHLWSPNSGRMIWMTHPAWPSTMWQMYSSDYDTQASFYAIKKANAPLHVQMDPSDGTVSAVNTTLMPRDGLIISAAVYSVSSELLQRDSATVDAGPNAVTTAFKLPLAKIFGKAPLVLIRLEMRDAKGALLADNFYWIAKEDKAYRALNDLPSASLAFHATAGASFMAASGPERTYSVGVRNTGSAAALEIKLTLLHSDGSRALPAYYSDNYLSMLPGESRTITIHVPETAANPMPLHFAVRGWNVPERAIAIAAP